MRLSDWRANDDLVQWMAKLTRSGNWKLLVEMMREEHPMNYVDTDPRITESQASKKLGVIEGWNMAMTNFQSAATPARVVVEPESVFEPQQAYDRHAQ